MGSHPKPNPHPKPHPDQAPVEAEAKAVVERSKQTLKAGWLFKKSDKSKHAITTKAWQRRWFVLEVETISPHISPHLPTSP